VVKFQYGFVIVQEDVKIRNTAHKRVIKGVIVRWGNIAANTGRKKLTAKLELKRLYTLHFSSLLSRRSPVLKQE
jgi:hypothetical protein